MDAKRKKAVIEAHAQRQYRLLPSSATSTKWSDVPDAVILDLVRSYADSGDAVLFGTSADQSVLAIRVYRSGLGYSVYSRGVERLGEAIERLYRMRPPRTQRAPLGAVGNPAVQVKGMLNLPFHPAFTVEQLAQKRLQEENRAIAWNALVDTFPRY